MTSPPTTELSATGPTALLELDRAITVLGLLVPVLTYVEVEATPVWYPTWLYFGELTIPAGILPAFVLAVVVLWRIRCSYRHSGRLGKANTIEGVLATIVVLLSIYAVWNLNVASPGVFWAGLPPMVFGVLLAVVVLSRDIAGLVAG